MTSQPLPRCLYHPPDDPSGVIPEGVPAVQYSTGHFPHGWEGVFVDDVGTATFAHKRCHEEATSGRACVNPSRGTKEGER